MNVKNLRKESINLLLASSSVCREREKRGVERGNSRCATSNTAAKSICTASKTRHKRRSKDTNEMAGLFRVHRDGTPMPDEAPDQADRTSFTLGVGEFGPTYPIVICEWRRQQ